LAILSSVADAADPFFHMVLAKGESWTDPLLLNEASAMIGGRQNPAEIARWFAALPKVAQAESYLDGLTRGLRLVRARNLQVPGADQTFARLLSSSSDGVQRAAWEASRHFALNALIRRAEVESQSPDLPPARRVLAVRALRGGHFDTVAPVIEKILNHTSGSFGGSAVDTLAAFDEPGAETDFDNWRGYVRRTQTRRGDAGTTQSHCNVVSAVSSQWSARAGRCRSHLYDDPDPPSASWSAAGSTNSDRSFVATMTW
jgi:hypothetical protein